MEKRTAEIDIQQLQLLNDRICQTLDALNQVRSSIQFNETARYNRESAFGRPVANQSIHNQQPVWGQPQFSQPTFTQPTFTQPTFPQHPAFSYQSAPVAAPVAPLGWNTPVWGQPVAFGQTWNQPMNSSFGRYIPTHTPEATFGFSPNLEAERARYAQSFGYTHTPVAPVAY